MRFVRTMLAFAIAFSVARLPLGASAAVGHAMPSDDMQAAIHMADHGDMSMDDCCCPTSRRVHVAAVAEIRR